MVVHCSIGAIQATINNFDDKVDEFQQAQKAIHEGSGTRVGPAVAMQGTKKGMKRSEQHQDSNNNTTGDSLSIWYWAGLRCEKVLYKAWSWSGVVAFWIALLLIALTIVAATGHLG